MAITQEGYLHIRKEGSSYLLLRSPSHFHLVPIDANLTERKMERLLRIYPCDSSQLHELGIHFSAFKADTLRGVVITGYQTGDTLQLWLGRAVREYQLDRDYSDEQLSRFFSGYLITRRLPPKHEGLDPGLIRKITWSMHCIAILCAIVFYFISKPYKLWSMLCILCQLSAFMLTVLFPASFTFAEETKIQKKYIHKGKGHLLMAFVIPGIALCLRTLTDFTFSNHAFFILMFASILAFLVPLVIYLWGNKGIHNALLSVITIIVVVIGLGLGTIGQLNYVLDFDHADSQIAEVLDRNVTRHTKSTSYDCTVVLPDGESMEMTIPARVYRRIAIGDDVLVMHYDGAFAIPFSTVKILTE